MCHMYYLTHLRVQNLNNLAIFQWDQCIPYLKLELKLQLIYTEVLPLSDDPICQPPET